jgi:hypothetical protein
MAEHVDRRVLAEHSNKLRPWPLPISNLPLLMVLLHHRVNCPIQYLGSCYRRTMQPSIPMHSIRILQWSNHEAHRSAVVDSLEPLRWELLTSNLSHPPGLQWLEGSQVFLEYHHCLNKEGMKGSIMVNNEPQQNRNKCFKAKLLAKPD